MFRELRRKEKATGLAKAEEILKNGEIGVLSTVCETGYPYGVPLQYAYFGGSIYFHCAAEGQKTDNLRADDRVSFCVVGRYVPLPGELSAAYESVVVFGRAHEIRGEEKDAALAALVTKYAPGYESMGREHIGKAGATTTVVKISPEHVCGKARAGRAATAAPEA